MENKWPRHEELGSVLLHFPAKVLDENTIIYSSDTSSTWYYQSRWLLGDHKQRSSFAWPLIVLAEIFLNCDFNSASKWLINVSLIATIGPNNGWSSTWNLSFCKVAMSRRFCFCSAIKQWGTHVAEIILFFKSLVKIRNTDVAGTPVYLESSSYIARRSSSRASATSFTLPSSVDVLGLPGLGSLSMFKQSPRKRLAHQETVLRSTVNSSQTSFKTPWISVGILPHKVSILIYDLWSEIVPVPDTPAGSISSSC